MARKPRDYKAEYARRNVIAQSHGFKTYNEYRRKYEKGLVEARQPSRIRSSKTRNAQLSFSQSLFQRHLDAIPKDVIAQEWSDHWAKTGTIEFHPEDVKLINALQKHRGRKQITLEEYIQTYLDAFVYAPNNYRKGGYMDLRHTQALKRFLVDWQEYYETNEYDGHYRVHSTV